ncbi:MULTISPECIES: hypothetical protein [unclassified Streptomyces]|uniref:hypothetical protein n=1 Tax=unclassified Streptomyces TaxID=2593676 RepID=UPI0003608A27|nr:MULTISPECIES: hypothetical protein [unclassified Streptomyces]MYT30915.1 hypothetical protein [Streptomyces sp. SID8354]
MTINPAVGDEVEYAPDRVAIVTDIREDVVILRRPGYPEWPATDPKQLRVKRTRAQRIADVTPR